MNTQINSIEPKTKKKIVRIAILLAFVILVYLVNHFTPASTTSTFIQHIAASLVARFIWKSKF